MAAGYYMNPNGIVPQAASYVGNQLYDYGVRYVKKRLRDWTKVKRKPKSQSSKRKIATKSIARGSGKRLILKKTRFKRRKVSLKKRVTKLERLQSHATHDYRQVITSVATCSVSECGYKLAEGMVSSVIETSIDALTYMDRAATPALDTINVNNNGLRNKFNLNNCYVRFQGRNNMERPIWVDVYCYVCKDDTSQNPIELIQADQANVGISVDAEVNPLLYPSDFDAVKSHWKLVKHAKAFLNTGDMIQLAYTRKQRKYDPELKDSTPETYLKGDQIFLIRVAGCISHDVTAQTSVGSIDGQLDYHVTRKWKVQYPSDAPFYKIETQVGLSNQSNGAIAGGPTVDSALT